MISVEAVTNRLPDSVSPAMRDAILKCGDMLLRDARINIQPADALRSGVDGINSGKVMLKSINPTAIRILIVDDHPMLREGLAAVIANEPDMSLVGEASNGEEGIERFRALQPDVTLMDLQMPGMDGVEAIATIRAEAPEAKILVLTTYAGDAQALRALRAGAAGYLLKSSLRHELMVSVRAVYHGERAVAAPVAHQIAIHAATEPLSDREISVLEQVALGMANKEISRRLEIGEETVKSHLKNIYSKLNVDDRAHAVAVANRRGILSFR